MATPFDQAYDSREEMLSTSATTQFLKATPSLRLEQMQTEISVLAVIVVVTSTKDTIIELETWKCDLVPSDGSRIRSVLRSTKIESGEGKREKYATDFTERMSHMTMRYHPEVHDLARHRKWGYCNYKIGHLFTKYFKRSIPISI
jgi:hypothetical protein